jgi:hypothetical protein
MKKLLIITFGICVLSVLFPVCIQAAGISVDAGLTPPEDRWIVRTMGVYMRREKDPTAMDRKMNKYTLNTVLAYGLRPDLTLMLKQPAVYQEMTRNGVISKDTGVGDLSLIAKYRILRRNTREYTLGLSAIAGLEPPTGTDAFSSETWDFKPGIYISLRRDALASDFNIGYNWNGFSDDGKGGVNPGDELSLDYAIAYQFSFGEEAEVALAPVLELSYKHISSDRLNDNKVINTGESVFYISPGLKFTKSSFILEALVQIPTWQDQNGSQTKRGVGYIVGTRFMF